MGGTVSAFTALVHWGFPAPAGALAWMLAEWIARGRPSLLGLCSGLVAGLVAVTPAAGFVTLRSALLIGLIAGVACYWGATEPKRLLGAADSLDMFGVVACWNCEKGNFVPKSQTRRASSAALPI